MEHHRAIGGSHFGTDGGTGTLTIEASGKVDASGDTVLWTDGLLRLMGGAFATPEFDFQGGQFQWTAGTLRTNHFDGNLIVPEEATLGVEYETAGSLTVTGNYHHQADARLLIDVGGIVPGSYSRTTSDGHDFLTWQRQFGSGVNSLASAQVVPEPTMVSLLVIALATMPRFPHAQTTKFRPVVTLPLI